MDIKFKIIRFSKKILENILPEKLLYAYSEKRRKSGMVKWEKSNKPLPPPHYVKQTIIREYQDKSAYKILIETGTQWGNMIFAQLACFDSIFSIELSEKLYARAVKRFKRYKHVHLIYGDSGIMLANVMKNISEPAIFWLDGHYSAGITAKGEKECPIWEELNTIIKDKQPHILLIDDARCFIGENDYPTILELQQFFENQNIPIHFEVKDDVIIICLLCK